MCIYCETAAEDLADEADDADQHTIDRSDVQAATGPIQSLIHWVGRRS